LKATREGAREERIKLSRAASMSASIQHNLFQSGSGAAREEIEALDSQINDLRRDHDNADRELENILG
jgi:hypothetical protein